MNIERGRELATRLFMGAGFVLLALAVAEKIANLQGQTMIRAAYHPSDLLRYAVFSLVFAIALLLHSIRNELRRR